METVSIELKEGRSHKWRAYKILYGKPIRTSNQNLIKYCRLYPEKFSVTLLKVEDKSEDNQQSLDQRPEEESNFSEDATVEKPKKRGRKKKIERKAVVVDDD